MIRTAFFDMGNVLTFFSNQRLCEQVAAVCQKTPQQIEELFFHSTMQVDFECGRLSVQQLHVQFETEVGCKVDLGELQHAVSDIFTLNHEILPILDELKSRGVRLVVLSNTNELHAEFIRSQFDVLDRFDDFVFSYEVGAMKPSAAIYKAALEKADCKPNECFYTDDIKDYISAAQEFGIQAELFTSAAEPRLKLTTLLG